MIPYDSIYGNYRTRTFSDIFDSLDEFTAWLTSEDNAFGTEIRQLLTDNDLRLIYGLLYAKYGNSHIASSSEDQFIWQVASIIYQKAPLWKKKTDVQKKLREMTDADLQLGTKQIVNHSNNPSTAPSTATLEELTTIDQQNTMTYKKSKLEGYANLLLLLRDDPTDEFLSYFKRLFLVIVEPQEPLWYVSDGN